MPASPFSTEKGTSPSQPVKDVYEVVAGGIDSALANFNALAKTGVAQFEELTIELRQ